MLNIQQLFNIQQLPLIQQLPPYLFLSIIAFVVFPSIVSICLRWALHKHLVFLEKRVRRLINRGEHGNQPKIITELETRFKEASRNVEQVNTVALIDQVYSQEKVLFISCEQINYFCHALPGLLLAFGLLGTFLGITINLSELSGKITQIDSNNVSSLSNLVQEIQKPLQGMGIAFTTSLAGISFSALLTGINVLKNTGIAKHRLVSAIEDYLDNIYLPKVQQGSHRLDKAVDRLVNEFGDFLSRFGTTVRDAVESSLGAKIQQIVDVNEKAGELARQVYNGFQESAGTIAHSTNQLQNAVSVFENSVAIMLTNVEKYQQTVEIFENSRFPRKLLEATAHLEQIQSNFSKSAISLANAAQPIEKAVNELQSSSKKVVSLGEEFSTLNQNSIQVLELHKNNQQSLSEIIPQLDRGAQHYQSAVTGLDNLLNQFKKQPDSLHDIQVDMSKLVNILKQHTQQVNQGIHTVSDLLKDKSDMSKLVNILKQHTQQVNQGIHTVSDLLIDKSNSLRELPDELIRTMELFKSHQPSGDINNNNLKELQAELPKLMNILKENREQINQGIEILGDRLIKTNKFQTRMLEEKLEEISDKVTPIFRNMLFFSPRKPSFKGNR